MSPRRARLQDRPTGDVVVLIIAATICLGVSTTGLSVIVIAFTNPDQDNTVAVRFVTSVISTLVGLLAGFLAGRTEEATRRTRETKERDETPD